MAQFLESISVSLLIDLHSTESSQFKAVIVFIGHLALIICNVDEGSTDDSSPYLHSDSNHTVCFLITNDSDYGRPSEYNSVSCDITCRLLRMTAAVIISRVRDCSFIL